MAPHHRKATHSKAEEDATCEANITAAWDQWAEQECSQAIFTGTIKTKKPEDLHNIAAALRMSKTGLKAELLQRILQHFDDDPDLKKNPRYEGLFNPSHSRRCCLNNNAHTTELVQEDTLPPPNKMHEPFEHQPQPPHTWHPYFAPAPSQGSTDFWVGSTVCLKVMND